MKSKLWKNRAVGGGVVTSTREIAAAGEQVSSYGCWKTIGMLTGPRIAGMSRQIGGPANEGLRRRMCVQRRRDFQPRQRRTEAKVRTVSEAQRSWSRTTQPKLVGLVENGWIAIGGGYDSENRLPAGYFDDADEMVHDCRTRHGLHRTVEP
jgi:hypothetical protein